jgi:hypothetical protein
VTLTVCCGLGLSWPRTTMCEVDAALFMVHPFVRCLLGTLAFLQLLLLA